MTANSLVEIDVINTAITKREGDYRFHVREAGKQSRKAFTDAVKAFCEYVDPQGDQSSDPDAAYMRYTTKLYSPLGLNSKVIKQLRDADDLGVLRDYMSARVLFALSVLEDDLAVWIPAAIARNELRSVIKKHMGDEAKKTASFCGVEPKPKAAKKGKPS